MAMLISKIDHLANGIDRDVVNSHEALKDPA
jgi:hypothetical protein